MLRTIRFRAVSPPRCYHSVLADVGIPQTEMQNYHSVVKVILWNGVMYHVLVPK